MPQALATLKKLIYQALDKTDDVEVLNTAYTLLKERQRRRKLLLRKKKR